MTARLVLLRRSIAEGAVRGAVGVFIMTAWEWSSRGLGFPRSLDWIVNEWVARSVPLAFVIHIGVGVLGGVFFEVLWPRSIPRVTFAAAYAFALQVLLLALAVFLVPLTLTLVAGSVIGHVAYALGLGLCPVRLRRVSDI